MNEQENKALAAILEQAARQTTWDPHLWERYEVLRKNVVADSFIATADENLIHLSGLFNERNILGVRTKPDAGELSEIQLELLAISYALTNNIPYERLAEAKKAIAAFPQPGH